MCIYVCAEGGGGGEFTYVLLLPHTSPVGTEVNSRTVQLNKRPQTSLKQVGNTV
jgi:hypothetical protein